MKMAFVDHFRYPGDVRKIHPYVRFLLGFLVAAFVALSSPSANHAWKMIFCPAMILVPLSLIENRGVHLFGVRCILLGFSRRRFC